MNENFDAARLTLLLSELRLPATKKMWPVFAELSDKEGWPAARQLTVLAENELAEVIGGASSVTWPRAKLLPDKTLDNFDFNAISMVSKAQVMAVCAEDEWPRNGSNVLLLKPPGGGKSHLSSAIGLALLEKGWRVLFARISDLVQRQQVARR
jgi:DNA replication protein DnaC